MIMGALTETSNVDMSQMSGVMAGLTKTDASAPRTSTHRPSRKQLLVSLLTATAMAGLAGVGAEYWTTGRFQVSTDDAYVAADSTAVAPKVSGYIKDVLVADNQAVKAGQVLATIDDSDFATALERAKASVVAAEADVDNLQAQIEQQKQAVIAARSTLTADRASQSYAQQDYRRFADLLKTGYGTVQRVQQTQSAIRQADATVQRDIAAVASAEQQSGILTAQLAKANAALKGDQALEQQAELNESYTTIVAAVDGNVGARSLRVGSYVQAGTQLMQIVPLHAVYVTANYKETQLTDVHAGQPVQVEVDTFPGLKIAGHVDSLSPASGQEFALLPPDNATGNFTKIVQRIPVKIVLEPNPAIEGKLRPGMSVEAEIDTKASASDNGSQVAAR
ncbi:MAG: HlyD family secretion protein [Rhodospirillaceae bacterium]|nr:MAG: HlyD family secretion protein [Rhodospirillaceae bacterium]